MGLGSLGTSVFADLEQLTRYIGRIYGDRIERGIPDGAVAIQAVGDGGDSAGVLIEYHV